MTTHSTEHRARGEWVPAKVRAYFRKFSRRRMIWPRMLHSDSKGWIDIAFASPKLHRQCGPHREGLAWPLDTTMVQWTDGDISADFTKRELVESGVAS